MTAARSRHYCACIAATAVICVSAFVISGCNNNSNSPDSPSNTTTTTTTSVSTTSSTTTVATSATLTVQLDPGCVGVLEPTGVDVFLDGVLVGTANQGVPFIRSGIAFGSHTLFVRDNLHVVPTTTFVIPNGFPFFTFTILCS
jgi:hypothetical protein